MTANNVANADTVGFKDPARNSRTCIAAGAANLNYLRQVGEGVRLATTAQQFTQGNISTSSSSNLDLAISGDGFFTLHRSQQRHSLHAQRAIRRGQERQCGDRHRPGAAGLSTLGQRRIQHRHAGSAQSTDGAEHTVGHQRRKCDSEPAGEFAPSRRSRLSIRPTRQTYNQSTSTSVYDSLGNQYPATFYFTQTAAPNQWNVNMTVNGTLVGGAQPLTFSNTGAVTAPVGGALTFTGFAPPGGAAADES